MEGGGLERKELEYGKQGRAEEEEEEEGGKKGEGEAAANTNPWQHKDIIQAELPEADVLKQMFSLLHSKSFQYTLSVLVIFEK